MEVKRHWLGNQWYLPGAAGNDIHKVSCKLYYTIICCVHISSLIFKTNVPDIRLAFRHQTLIEELDMLRAKNSVNGHGLENHGAVLPTADAVAARAMAKHS
jgi:AMP deaminase